MAGASSVESILKRIIERAQECLAHPSVLASSFAPQSCSPRQQPIANISLPDPPSIYSALLAAGACHDISLAINQAYQTRAAELRAFCHSAVARVYSNQAQYPSKFRYVPGQKVLPVFTELYLRQLSTWRQECIDLYLKHTSTSDKIQTSSGGPKFNHEYVPLLEYFFAENPFPTHADKAFLAKKSAMTYRQIHVWFQNRRNRMKKEGQVLRKKAVVEGATLPLDSLYRRMEKFIVPEEKKVPTSPPSPLHSLIKQRDEMMSIADDRSNALEPLAPLHAFPYSYPPSCSYDPFPSKNGVTNFGAPKWFRRPMTTAVRCPTLDIDGLVDRFSRINILDDSGLRSRCSVDSYAAVAAITIIPFPAPLPALIRGTATRIAPIRVPLLSVPATASRRHVFNTPSPQSRPITLMPASETPGGQKARRRKMAPLPKRIPHRDPVSHRGVTPAVSEASIASPSPSSCSRSSSFGSESSSQSRLFSSASSMSSSSSGIITPPPFPSPSIQASPPTSLYNFSSNMTDLFGDALESVPSPVEGLQLDFNSTIFGHEHIPKSSAFDFSFGAPPAADPVRAPP
ncbi:homeodomain protein 2 [Suillus fuscotomentosus]|uniref:Homeodomain protein 2 n=1 Tax=Suillus fuscotomentosus TaxID=1912939 RepID=A0AAD4HQ42_9AGAM|nr:homeodomain protein 2 [Suillus fuscotomentosus]KAG1904677.1 homeodomain protein 2 [Suillus fuscotomentosus]